MTDATTEARQWPEFRCRDAALIPAAPPTVWTVLTDLATWADWWTLIRVAPLDVTGGTTLGPGFRFRITGSRPGASSARGWNVEVTELVPVERIELAYTDGDLVGRAAWELAAVAGGTEAAYVYRGVRPTNPDSAASFERYGTRLHSVAMHVDALAGLARYVRGEPLDDAWRATVQRAMADGVAALPGPGR